MKSNLRTLTGWRRFLDIWFCRYRWARQLIGGKWELWYVDPICATSWHPVTHWATPDCRPTVVCIGPVERSEDWSTL